MPQLNSDDIQNLVEKLPKLNLKEVEGVEFERNLIRTTVSELRFPTLLEYEINQPVKLQHALRKEYPLYEPQESVSVGLGTSAATRQVKYLFRDVKRHWTVAFSPSSIALESAAGRYKNFEDFWERLQRLISKSQSVLDTDFYTRVGLRYVNMIEIGGLNPAGWINPALVQPLTDGVYGTVTRFLQEVRGFTEYGDYMFRHGVVEPESNFERIVYTLDFDFSKENVQINDIRDILFGFNRAAYQFFSWAIGDKTRERLGKQTIKHETKND